MAQKFHLDHTIVPLPKSFTESFDEIDDGERFHYEVSVGEIRFCSTSSIFCTVTISKYRKIRWWRWTMWKTAWSFSAESETIIDWKGRISDSHRRRLVTLAINKGILLTDLLLDKLLGKIKFTLKYEHTRFKSLRSIHGSGVVDDRTDGQAANE